MKNIIKKLIEQELKSSGNVVIRKITNNDLKEIIPRLGEVFSKTGLSSQQIWGMMQESDLNKSVVATVDGNVAGFYFFSNNQIPETGSELYYQLEDLNGVEGVALGVFKEYKNLGVGKKLIQYPKSMPGVDYIWGMQLKSLQNIDDWLKRRKIYAETPYLYVTYELFNKSLSEKWSNKYKRKIDCNNPKGFSQKAHCKGRKKRQQHKPTKSKSPFLNEIKAIDAYNQFYKGLADKQNQENDLSTYNQIVRLDPTFIENTQNLGQYTKWLFRKDNLAWILNNIKTRRGEDLYKIKEDLTLYEKAKRANQLPFDRKDIGKLNIETLSDLTFDLQNIQSKSEKEKEVKQGAKKYELSEWTIIIPQTEQAACYYGKGTKWCTASETNSQFDYYNRTGDLYIIINKDNPSEKYQFHFEARQFMDVMDRPIRMGEFFNDNEEVYDFFKKLKGDALDFIMCQSALEEGDTETFEYHYSNNFTDAQKKQLIRAAFEGDSNSDGYYTLTNALNYINYDGIGEDFRYDFLNGLEYSLGNKYDDENYDAKLFIDMIGGFTYENIDDILTQVDFKQGDEVQKIFQIANEYDNGLLILNKGLKDNDKEVNEDLLKTLDYLKNNFHYVARQNEYWSKVASVKINKIVDFQKGILEIEFTPLDSKGVRKPNEAVEGNVYYKNLIKYLTIPQISFLKKSKEELKESVKNNIVTCDNCNWQWNLKDGGNDPYTCHKCGHDNNPNILNEKCWKGYTQKGMKTMFGKKYPNCVKVKK